MKRILRTLLVMLISVACAGPLQAAPVLSILPADQVIDAPGSFFVTVSISGLQTGGPALLGAFSLDLVFDPARLTYLPFPPLRWGPGLGDVAAGEALAGIDVSTPGVVRLSAVSLLEADPGTCIFCLGPFLINLQQDTFALATLRFFYAGSSGSTRLQMANPLLADAQGNAIAVGAINGAVIRVPEPGNLSLAVLGMVLMAWTCRRHGRPRP